MSIVRGVFHVLNVIFTWIWHATLIVAGVAFLGLIGYGFLNDPAPVPGWIYALVLLALIILLLILVFALTRRNH